MVNILFVCSGDTCRSAMAATIARDKINKKNLKGLNCSSSGLFVTNEIFMNDKAKSVLKTLKVPVGKHRATQLTESIIKSNDYVLTMTEEQRQTILNRFPYFKHVYSLKDFVGADNISDPYGKSEAEYYNTAIYLDIVVDKVLEKIIKEGGRV